MGMNIVQIQTALKNMPDQTLVNYVQNPTPEVPQYLALYELQSRKQMRSRMQGQQAQQPQQPSVAQQEMAGVPSLPVGNMYGGEEFARGGIVSFAGGGDIDREISSALYNRDLDSSFLDPRFITYGVKDLLEAPFNYRTVIDPATGKPRKARDLYGTRPNLDKLKAERAAERAAWNQKIEELKNKKKGITTEKTEARAVKAAERSGAAYLPSQQPTDGDDIYGNINPKPDFLSKSAGVESLLARSPESDLQGGISGGAGVTRSASQRGQGVGAPQLSWTDLADRSGDFDKLMRKEVTAEDEMARRNAMLGEDTGREQLKQRLAAMEEEAAKEGKAAPWMALARAGLGMAAGNSQFALQNIATGGIEGLTDYHQAQERLRRNEDKRFDMGSRLAQAERAEQVQGVDYGLSREEQVRNAIEANRLQKLGYETNRDTANAQGRFDASKTNAQLSMDARKLAEQIRANMAQEGLTKSQINKEWDTVSRIAQQIRQDNSDITESEAIKRAYETKNPGFGASEQRDIASQRTALTNQLKAIPPLKKYDAERARIQAQLDALGSGVAAPAVPVIRFDAKGNMIQE